MTDDERPDELHRSGGWRIRHHFIRAEPLAVIIQISRDGCRPAPIMDGYHQHPS